MKKKIIFQILALTIVCFNSLGRVLPKEVEWNDDETGYYIIKENAIQLISTVGKEDKMILSSSMIGNINIESFLFSCCVPYIQL